MTKDKNYILVLFYFLITFAGIIATYFDTAAITFLAKLAAPFLLIVLYRDAAVKPNPLVYLLMTLILVGNMLFFLESSPYFVLIVLVSVLQCLLMLLIVFQLTTYKSYPHIFLASMPFLIIFYYLNSIANEFGKIEFNAMFFQSLLLSLFGGIALWSYLRNDNRQNSLLLISALLFIGLQFVIFIERYFFTVVSLQVFALVGILMNAFGFFSFYKFVTVAENAMQNDAR